MAQTSSPGASRNVVTGLSNTGKKNCLEKDALSHGHQAHGLLELAAAGHGHVPPFLSEAQASCGLSFSTRFCGRANKKAAPFELP